MELFDLDIKTIEDVKLLKKYYRQTANKINTLCEELYLNFDADLIDYQSKIELLERLTTEIRNRIYELQSPEFTDGIIDLYRDHLSHFTITKHNETIPIGAIEYFNTTKSIPGNISYEINKEFRGHHYALRALKLIGEALLNKGIKKIFITASSEKNYPSIKTIESFGGVRFYKEDYVAGPIPYTCDLERIYSK